jgi:glutamate carboxypeptidase
MPDASRRCKHRMTHPLLGYCASHLDGTIESIEALARNESPSTDKDALARCGRDLTSMLRAQGADVEIVECDGRGHVRASVEGTGAQRVLLLGHFDTVWPVGTLAGMPVRRDGSRLFGPGVFDMKAGIAIAMLAVDALRHIGTPHPPITMLWTSDEEIGSSTSRDLIETTARTSSAVLVLEPALPGGAVKTARKGCGEFELIVEGRAAHAGLDPGKGASAIHELAAQIAAIEALQDVEHGVTVNVGTISGGSRPNVVAAEARAVVDVRAPAAGDAARIDAALRALKPRRPGTRLTVKGGFGRPPLERTAGVVRLFSLAREVAASLGHDLREGSAGGGSDGNFTAALGVPTLDGLGAVGDGAHAVDEHIDVDALPWRAALVAGLIARL